MVKVFRVIAFWGALVCNTLLTLSLCFSRTLVTTTAASHSSKGYAGSETCRKCHEKFYRLWATSHSRFNGNDKKMDSLAFVGRTLALLTPGLTQSGSGVVS